MFGQFPLDSQGDLIGDGFQCQGRHVGKRPAGEQGHDPAHLAADHQRMAGESDQPLAAGPRLIVDACVADNLIRQVGLSLLSDQPNLELADRYPGVSTVQVSVHSRAGLELENVSLCTNCPDPCECRVEMLHDRLGAALQ